MPGRSAYMDGRRGASSMRLNFAGNPEEQIREGIRRIGKLVGGGSGLFGTLAGSPAPSAPRPQAGAGNPEPLAEVVELPRRRAKGR